jgi:hypothetical protein
VPLSKRVKRHMGSLKPSHQCEAVKQDAPILFANPKTKGILELEKNLLDLEIRVMF